MRYLKISLLAIFSVFALMVFDYSLPSTNIVKLVGTEVVRMQISPEAFFWSKPDSGTNSSVENRDVRFINGVFEDGRPRVFRNEDTSWSWPPYFKFSSGNLQAEAQVFAGSDRWVAVRHYGWRIKLLSVYPNALSVEEVTGPEAGSLNWVRIIAAILLAVAALASWRLSIRMKSWAAGLIAQLKSKL